MFGYACNETPELMPLPIAPVAPDHQPLTELRQNGTLPWLRPDSKSQVTIEYDGDTPVRVHTVVVSTQHDARTSTHEGRSERQTIIEQVIQPVLPPKLVDDDDHLPHQPDRQVRRRRPARRRRR